MDFSTVTVDLAPILTLGTTIVVALLALIPLRKAVKTANRT